MNEENFELVDSLMKNRIVLITQTINKETMQNVMLNLLALDSLSNEPISIYISSDGGDVMDGLAIIDIMNMIEAPIYTYSIGLVASMASIIFMNGSKRFITANSQIMLHQPLGGVQGQASDIEIAANRIIYIKNLINEMIAKKCNREINEIKKETDRDNYLTAAQAIEYGIADEIIY